MTPEGKIQRAILLALGAEPDLLIMKNTRGTAFFGSARVEYGLVPGAPDLVGILAPHGRWFCLEIKQPGEKATEEQASTHVAWRSFGAFVAVVHSVNEAQAALARARGEG